MTLEGKAVDMKISDEMREKECYEGRDRFLGKYSRIFIYLYFNVLRRVDIEKRLRGNILSREYISSGDS